MGIENELSGNEGRQIASSGERQIASKADDVAGLNLLSLSGAGPRGMQVADASSKQPADFTELGEKLDKYFREKDAAGFERLNLKLEGHYDKLEKEKAPKAEKKRS